MAPPVIYKATYSGVPVLEMPCKGVAVMRRRSDSWLNATQILKVAGFDKPQRTRVLEREVQKGTHEKIQGGYGKYQGTWVPFERGVELSKQYGVDHLLAPLHDYQPSANDSPPLAPKHITAPSNRGGKLSKAAAAARAQAVSLSATLPPAGGGRRTNNSRSNFDSESDMNLSMPPIRDFASTSTNRPGQSKLSRSTTATYIQAKTDSATPDIPVQADEQSELPRTPTPVEEFWQPPQAVADQPNRNKGKARDTLEQYEAGDDSNGRPPKRKYEDDYVPEDGYTEVLEDGYPDENASSPSSSKYARAILDYFVSESGQIPEFLINPPNDFDPNVMIDDDGHTALHWACAMGRIKIIKLLLACGADIFRANHVGQTALMRAVMFTNNYDLRKFPELFDSFHQSTINIDRNDRTVFHYVIDIALQKGKINAARYYLETILNRLSEYPKELADILNFQDDDGETALTLAARSRSKRLVKILLDHGANPKVANRDGKSAEDYILADEKFRGFAPASCLPSTTTLDLNSSDIQSSILNGILASSGSNPCATGSLMPVHVDQPAPPHPSQTGEKVMNYALPQMVEMIESLAASFDSALNEKENDLSHANGVLAGIQTELADGQKKLAKFQALLAEVGDKKSEQAALEAELKEKMGKRYRFGWEKYVRDEEEREKRFKEQQQSLIHQLQSESQPAVSSLDPHTNVSHQQHLAFSLRELEEQNSDLMKLLSIPGDVEGECERLRTNLANLRDERAGLFKEFINLSSENAQSDEAGLEAAATNRLNDYRKLISLGCGGIGLDEVDEVIDSLSHGLEFPVIENSVNGHVQPGKVTTSPAGALAPSSRNGSGPANQAHLHPLMS
ncbi:hypothetical protein CROQUDRAFT_720629 [Cronartium quercuum f. sp. fusiforme G11]|uniref:HTH APSES-type domain-containing protein n=1 Tax=Cronartium quercuum f. sp. fusiforme G11 TaxID=708437 RepID=A0A9P6NTP1_9BASI|nr:hypothetical protein CROQUDRAFT_720629 [Cronartium quercuum f. sp. fusiforme G11]